jgi:hypothetical protein
MNNFYSTSKCNQNALCFIENGRVLRDVTAAARHQLGRLVDSYGAGDVLASSADEAEC